jgi:hypothetical protein
MDEEAALQAQLDKVDGTYTNVVGGKRFTLPYRISLTVTA